MAGITGLATTFSLPNYVGPLFKASTEDTPFTSAIGGLSGGRQTTSTTFTWQGYDLRDADADRQRLEGAAAPTAEARVRFRKSNLVEIHQEAVDISYTKQAATGQYATTGAQNANAVGIAGTNPVLDEVSFQMNAAITQMKRDIEKSFVTNAGQDWPDNTAARKTTGIIAATTTNVASAGTAIGTATTAATGDTFTITAHGMSNGDQVVLTSVTTTTAVKADTPYYVVNTATNTFKLALTKGGAAIDIDLDGSAVVVKSAALSEASILDLMQTVWTNGGLQESETATLMCGAWNKRMLTKIFITEKNFREESRNVGGVALSTFETDFGRINIMLNRYQPAHKIQIVSLEQCAPVFLLIPSKGFLFAEPLAKTGSSDKYQLYGEVGLEYGNEMAHGKLTGLTISA